MATREVTEAELSRAQIAGRRAMREGADHLHMRQLGDGCAVFLLPMLHGNLRLAIGDPRVPYFDDGWCYQAEQTEQAWRAVLGWDGEGEPEGWYRHPDTGRRRPDGDPAKEHVAP